MREEILYELKKKLSERTDVCYDLNAGLGSRGNIKPFKTKNIPNVEDYPLPNCFFKYIQITYNKHIYNITCRRFYIDNKNKINCRFGEFQFDVSNDGNVNKIEKNKIIIAYPKSYKGQSKKMIRIDQATHSCVYNPSGLGNIYNCDPKNVVDTFVSFRDECEKYIKDNPDCMKQL